jgi:hypothetical protein
VRKALVIAAILLALGAIGGVAFAVRPDAYGGENERLLARLPPYPGSRQIAVNTRRYDSASWRTRYVTEATFELERRASETSLRRYFASQLGRGWRWTEEDGCSAFVRDDGVLVVALDSFEPKDLRVLLDLHGRDNCEDFVSIATS